MHMLMMSYHPTVGLYAKHLNLYARSGSPREMGIKSYPPPKGGVETLSEEIMKLKNPEGLLTSATTVIVNELAASASRGLARVITPLTSFTAKVPSVYRTL